MVFTAPMAIGIKEFLKILLFAVDCLLEGITSNSLTLCVDTLLKDELRLDVT